MYASKELAKENKAILSLKQYCMHCCVVISNVIDTCEIILNLILLFLHCGTMYVAFCYVCV